MHLKGNKNMKMTKSLLSAGLVNSILCSTSYSADSHTLNKAHHGFFVGANVGYIISNTIVKRLINTGINPITLDSSNHACHGVNGGFNLGYQHLFKSSNLVAGLDLKSNFSNLRGKVENRTVNQWATALRLKMTNTLGAALRFGILWHNVQPYLKVGYVSSQWKAESSLPPAANVGNGQFKRTKRLSGIEFGIGLDVPMTKCLTFGGEFSHEAYQKIFVIHRTLTGLSVINHKITPSATQFILRVKYKLSSFEF
jgi:hypothetical protein